MTTETHIMTPQTPAPPVPQNQPETAAVQPRQAPPSPWVSIIDDPDDETAREEAFASAPQWNGAALLPFSVERYGIFVAQRVSMGAPSLYHALRDGSAFFPDAVRILWICSQPPSVLSSLRRDPEAMQEAIDSWAEANCPVHRGAEAVNEAIRIFNDATVGLHASAKTHNPNGSNPSKN